MNKKVASVMRRGALTCSENASIREVAQILLVNRILYCIVTNQNREVMGIISARSILKAFGRDLDETKARDILLPYTITITPNCYVREAVDLMKSRRIEHLVVVSDRPGRKALLGILSASDVIDHMIRTDEGGKSVDPNL